MKIYLHKVRSNSENGFGKNSGLKENILGYFKDRQSAEEHKKERDLEKSPAYTMFDVGKSWIEEQDLK